MQDFVFKVIVVGNRHAGKTSFVKRAVHNEFSSIYKPTIGADFGVKILRFPNEGYSIYLQLWDIQGQDRNTHIMRLFFKGAVGAIVVYDVANEDSLHIAHQWKKEIDNLIRDEAKEDEDESAPPPFPTLLVGNKCDLERCQFLKNVNMQQICETYGYFSHMEVSAKRGDNVENAIQEIVQRVIEERKQEFLAQTEGDTFKLDDQPNEVPSVVEGRRCFVSSPTNSESHIHLAPSNVHPSEHSAKEGFHLYNSNAAGSSNSGKPTIESKRCCI